MTYTPHTWIDDEPITDSLLNHLEQGIYDVDAAVTAKVLAPVRQAISTAGVGALAAGSGLTVNHLAATTNMDATWANGFNAAGSPVDYSFKFDTDVTGAWAALTTNCTNYLYVDYNNGSPQRGALITAPRYSIATPAPSNASTPRVYVTGETLSGGNPVDTMGNVTFTGVNITQAAGQRGQALSFNGTGSYAAISANQVVATYTVMGWLYHNNAGASVAFWSDGDAGGTDLSSRINLFKNTSNQLTVTTGNGTTGTVHTFNNYAMPAATFVHVAVTVDGTNVKLYINGVLTQTITQGTALPGTSPGGTFALGRAGSLASFYLNGRIDDFRLYQNTVLNADAIALLARGPGPWYVFNTSQMKGYVITEAGAVTPVNYLFMGEAVTNGSAVTSVVQYASQGRYLGARMLRSASTNVTENHNIGTDLVVTMARVATAIGASLKDVPVTGLDSKTITYNTGSGAVEAQVIAMRAF